MSIDTITQKIIELDQPNLVCDLIKISVGIAYEQNRPTGVASALRGQFGFWAKSALKKALHKYFLKTKVVTNHNTQLMLN